MDKAHKVIAWFLIISVIIIAALYMISIREPYPGSCDVTAYSISASTGLNLSGTIIYYGDTCPHCKIVEDFIKSSSIDSKIEIVQKEVFENKTNQDEFLAVGKLCNLPQDYLGAVPMMYSENSCYLGDRDIICVLKEKAGVK